MGGQLELQELPGDSTFTNPRRAPRPPQLPPYLHLDDENKNGCIERFITFSRGNSLRFGRKYGSGRWSPYVGGHSVYDKGGEAMANAVHARLKQRAYARYMESEKRRQQKMKQQELKHQEMKQLATVGSRRALESKGKNLCVPAMPASLDPLVHCETSFLCPHTRCSLREGNYLARGTLRASKRTKKRSWKKTASEQNALTRARSNDELGEAGKLQFSRIFGAFRSA